MDECHSEELGASFRLVYFHPEEYDVRTQRCIPVFFVYTMAGMSARADNEPTETKLSSAIGALVRLPGHCPDAVRPSWGKLD